MKRTAILAIFAVGTVAAFAAAAPSAPTYTNTSTGRSITATVTADTPGVYTLDSTYFRLGPDPWGRTRRTATLTAGETVTFTYPCASSRATYGYRITTPTGTGATTWAKCQ